MIVVSHDQFFISRVCKELWTIRTQSIIRFKGEFEEYKNLVSKGKIWPVCCGCLVVAFCLFCDHITKGVRLPERGPVFGTNTNRQNTAIANGFPSGKRSF